MAVHVDPGQRTFLYSMYVSNVRLAQERPDLAETPVVCRWHSHGESDRSQKFKLANAGGTAHVDYCTFLVVSFPDPEDRSLFLRMVLASATGDEGDIATAFLDLATFSPTEAFKVHHVDLRNQAKVVATAELHTASQQRWMREAPKVPTWSDGHFVNPLSDCQAGHLYKHIIQGALDERRMASQRRTRKGERRAEQEGEDEEEGSEEVTEWEDVNLWREADDDFCGPSATGRSLPGPPTWPTLPCEEACGQPEAAPAQRSKLGADPAKAAKHNSRIQASVHVRRGISGHAIYGCRQARTDVNRRQSSAGSATMLPKPSSCRQGGHSEDWDFNIWGLVGCALEQLSCAPEIFSCRWTSRGEDDGSMAEPPVPGPPAATAADEEPIDFLFDAHAMAAAMPPRVKR